MFYKLSFDMDRLDGTTQVGMDPIYAEKTNLDEFEHGDFKKGYYRYVIEDGKYSSSLICKFYKTVWPTKVHNGLLEGLRR